MVQFQFSEVCVAPEGMFLYATSTLLYSSVCSVASTQSGAIVLGCMANLDLWGFLS